MPATSRSTIPDRCEHRQDAKRAAADIEGHSEAAKFGKPGRLSAPPPSSILAKRTWNWGAIMRGWAILLAVLAIAGFAVSASAKGKIRLAQSSVTTTCMMTCNAQYANCQSSCLSTGTPNLPGANVSASQSCLSSCTNQQLQCQITCARASPSR